MKKKTHFFDAYGYWILTFSVFAALLIVLLILDSNIKPVLVAQAQPQKAMGERFSMIRDALKSDPHNTGLNIDMANVLFDMQNYREAMVYYNRALRHEPSNIAPQIDLAICYYNLQLVDSALVEIKKALEIDPGHVKGLYNIGIMYYNSNQIDLARQYWLKLINLHRETPEAQRALKILNSSKS